MKEDIKLIIGYIKGFFSKKKLIVVSVGIMTIIGLLTLILDPKEYNSSSSFIAQLSSDSGVGSGLKNIASLIGVNIGNEKDQKDIPIYLYPKLMSSLDYNRELLNTKVSVKGELEIVTLKDYYLEHKKGSFTDKLKKYTVGLPGLVLSSLRPKSKGLSGIKRIDSLDYVSNLELVLLKHLSEDMVFHVDEFDGSIEIQAIMQDPTVAAQATESAKKILQDKIIEYRLSKAREQYDFIEEQHKIKKEEYIKAQSNLAYYIDKNRFNNTEKSLLRRRQLENEVNLAFIVYSELENKRISSEISLNEDTPVFTSIQKSIVPIKSLKSNPIIVLLKHAILGFLTAIFIYVFVILFNIFKSIWRAS